MDFDLLEQYYNKARDFEKKGQLSEAAKIYQKIIADVDPQDHVGASMRLASIGYSDSPKQAPTSYVRTLFDQTAESFDYILVNQLEYQVPFKLRKLLDTTIQKDTFISMLDLGCGTGLCGEAFEDKVQYKVGVDLSEKMIEIADEKGDYDDLFIAAIDDFLAQNEKKWDLILAADLLPYLGDVANIFQLIYQAMPIGGCFCFSTELLKDETEKDQQHKGYKVGPHYRFAHQSDYLYKLLKKLHYSKITHKETIIRLEQNQPVLGQMIIGQKL